MVQRVLSWLCCRRQTSGHAAENRLLEQRIRLLVQQEIVPFQKSILPKQQVLACKCYFQPSQSHSICTPNVLQAMIGNRIRKAREDAGITQEQCARLSGIDTSVYNRIENNKREPTASELMRILPVVKATPAYLLGMEKPAHQNGNGAAAPPAGAGEAPSATDALTLMAQAVLVMVQEQTRRSARKAKVALKRVTKRKKRAGGGSK